MKSRILTLFVAISLIAQLSLSANDSKHIMVYPTSSKGDIVEKIENLDWAKSILDSAHSQVDSYVEQHQEDKMWILSRMQMYWKNHYTTPYINGGEYSRGEGSAPAPTVRFTGARDWVSEYFTPSLEDIKPYMEYNDDQMYLQNRAKEGKPWEWVDNGKTAHIIEGVNVNIMNRAMYSAFIYWLSGEEKYARFAYDIFALYIDAMYYREPPVTEVDHRNSHLLGLTSFEVIHERVVYPLVMCYNFLQEYIIEQQADISRVDRVFQNFADQIILNGVPHNNWNVFQARFITYLALSLSDDSAYENGRGKQYYIDFILNQNAPRQRALTLVRDIYDPSTALWNESPGYSISTTEDMLEVLSLIDGVDSEDIFKEFEIIERAAYSLFEYELPNKRITAFGDGGYNLIGNVAYETLLSYYSKYGYQDKAADVAAIINDNIESGLYDRGKGASLFELFNYVDVIDSEASSESEFHSALFYAPNINLTIMRSGVDEQSALMLVNSGTGFNHNNNNGINLELYGKGYMLGLDKGRGSSYWVDDHHHYYNAPISHNTVIVDGVSTNSGPEMKEGVESRHTLHSSYPAQNQKDASSAPVVMYVDNEFDEQSTQSTQRRFNSIIRAANQEGYYLDIFRSAKREGGDKMHDYLYHNVAQSLHLYGESGEEITLSESSDLNSQAGNAKGYDYISGESKISYDEDFRATFCVATKQGDIAMDLWMGGSDERDIYSILTPKPLKGYDGLFSKEVAEMAVPALLVRQKGEAWKRPFVAIYEPYSSSEGSSIQGVNFEVLDDDAVAVEVLSKSDSREVILNTLSPQGSARAFDTTLDGVYGVVSVHGSEPSYLFMAEASELSWGDYSICSLEPTTLLVEWCDCGALKVAAHVSFTLDMPRGGDKTLNYIDSDGVKRSVAGSVVKTNHGKRLRFEIEM
ncbi:MAG: hypothetical protein SNJ33_06110 [Rikenellaceae bacterium]